MTIQKKILGRASAALLLAAAFGMASASVADEPTAKAAVQVSDLNLHKAKDQRKLERRTAAAINQVCPDRGSAIGPPAASSAAYRECAQTVRADVKRQVNQQVAAYSDSRE